MIDLKELIKSGVYFGHQKTRWCPKMAPYIWGHKSGIHLIDVSKTAYNLEKASQFLKSLAEQRKSILFVGTKQAAQQIVAYIAKSLEMPYINHRWVGGMLTNYPQVRKSVTKLLHYEDILTKSEESNYTKKELNQLQKSIDKLQKTVGGIRKLSWPIGAVVIVDVKKEDTAVKEANQSGIPIVALVDTNGDPSLIDYVIPANDDSPKSIRLILDYLAKAVQDGKEKAAQIKAAKEEVARAEEALNEPVAGMRELEEESEESDWGKENKKAKPVIVKKIVKDIEKNKIKSK